MKKFGFSLRSDAPGKRLEEQPFKVLVLGNFSGRAAAQTPLAKRRIAAANFERLGALRCLPEPGAESIPKLPKSADQSVQIRTCWHIIGTVVRAYEEDSGFRSAGWAKRIDIGRIQYNRFDHRRPTK